MFLQILISSLIIISIAVFGLGFNLIFRKNGKFPETGVGHNPEMRKRGLTCARTDEIRHFQLDRKILATKNGQKIASDQMGGCSGCNCGD